MSMRGVLGGWFRVASMSCSCSGSGIFSTLDVPVDSSWEVFDEDVGVVSV